MTPYNYIEFQGVGTLKGVGGNRVNHGAVYFYARAEDHGEPGQGVDRYYLRVYDTTGNTLLLVSANPGDPTDVAPVAISTGNIQLHVSGCAPVETALPVVTQHPPKTGKKAKK